MDNDETKRHEASELLIRLRSLMGLTQQRMAVEQLHCAVATVGGYETNRPPRGDALVALAEIAERATMGRDGRDPVTKELSVIASRFRELFMEEMAAKVGGQFVIFPASDREDMHGYIVQHLKGQKQLLFMQRASQIAAALDSTDPAIRKIADEASAYLRDAARRANQNPIADKETTTPTTTGRKKK